MPKVDNGWLYEIWIVLLCLALIYEKLSRSAPENLSTLRNLVESVLPFSCNYSVYFRFQLLCTTNWHQETPSALSCLAILLGRNNYCHHGSG